ncbi:MAG: hypothetical protein AABZ30_13140 [Myxococcota bacterium]
MSNSVLAFAIGLAGCASATRHDDDEGAESEAEDETCGDGECGGGETCATCSQDCGDCCGDGACAGTETCRTCRQDCGDCCGNGDCGGGESCANCPEDCHDCCGDGECGEGETCATCPGDCGDCCGDDECGEGETCAACPEDCGICCDNDMDDDSDGFTDFPDEPGCASPEDEDELDPATPAECANGEDDDKDEATDYPDDPGCDYAADDDERDCIEFGSDVYGYVGCEQPTTLVPCPDIAATGTALSLGDDTSETVAIGFSFLYYGTAQTTAAVSSNGVLGFPTLTSSFANSCLPVEANTIYAFWDDLYPPQTGSTVRYATSGSAPSRTFEVQWRVAHFPSSPEEVDVRVVLHETTNVIEVCYVDTTFGDTNDGGASATTGIQGLSGQFIEYSCDEAVLTEGLVLRYEPP